MEFSNRIDMTTHGRKRTLVIMAKAPKPGGVKTRLAQSFPDCDVTELYRCLLRDTLTLARSLNGVEIAIMTPQSDVDELTEFVLGEVPVVAQSGEGLVAGLNSVFSRFAADGARGVIAFNSDSPHLPAAALERAFDELAECDVVVGPTHDGGYYMVGANAVHPGLFDNDGMGTSSALDNLMSRVRDLRLSVRIAEPFYDVDVAADLMRLDAELQLFPARAPRTAAWLAEW
ncbi:MAG TPA: TIGR04282 family arsenosugar biosynthesis glycosyltransferase, partial [Candidatus Acidoferrales bacterium]|nr:TIGR04282 family arsenosugar biosynthesis glycosyltransferase [Candidatus Acidoferrales bacterium]